MKQTPYLLIFLFLLAGLHSHAQYTDVINSNRPGSSDGAFAVGKNVLQGEFGILYEKQEHSGLLTETNDLGLSFAIRYGFLFEELEVLWEGTYIFQEFTFNGFNPPLQFNNNDFLMHTIGAKYLVYDPYKKERKPNLYSWRANNKFQWRDLIPSISVYAGANLFFADNPFVPEDTSISPKVAVLLQNHFPGNWVLVSNIIYDRFTEDDPILSYIITLTHALNNPKWSIFIENQGVNSDDYADVIFRGGAAHLINKNLQVDALVGFNVKDTPSRLFGAIGVSFRLDYHKDELIIIDDSNLRKDKKKRKKKNKDPFIIDN
ncbi:transporter [Leptobacterium sp. I13]|uniref:transporter n=1 Tax=Leptobacterium meishanense TaxID=3128904 RepID=UPI0030EDBC5B